MHSIRIAIPRFYRSIIQIRNTTTMCPSVSSYDMISYSMRKRALSRKEDEIVNFISTFMGEPSHRGLES